MIHVKLPPYEAYGYTGTVRVVRKLDFSISADLRNSKTTANDSTVNHHMAGTPPFGDAHHRPCQRWPAHHGTHSWPSPGRRPHGVHQCSAPCMHGRVTRRESMSRHSGAARRSRSATATGRGQLEAPVARGARGGDSEYADAAASSSSRVRHAATTAAAIGRLQLLRSSCDRAWAFFVPLFIASGATSVPGPCSSERYKRIAAIA